MAITVTKEQFLLPQDSATVRAICVSLALLTLDIMHGGTGPEAIRQWDAKMQELRDVGVTPGVDVGHVESTYAADPVLFARYIAGQWLEGYSKGRELLLEANAIARASDTITIAQPWNTLCRQTIEWFDAEYDYI